MCDLPGPGIESASLALAGGGKPLYFIFYTDFLLFFFLQLSHSLYLTSTTSSSLLLFIYFYNVVLVFAVQRKSAIHQPNHTYIALFFIPFPYSTFWWNEALSPFSVSCLHYKAIPKVVCCFIFLQGVLGHFPRLPPLTVFFSNEASASEEKNSFRNSHGYTKLPVLLDSPSCLQREKAMVTRAATTVSNGIWLSDYHLVKSVVCRRLLGRNHKTRMTTRGHQHTFNNIYLQKPREDFCCKGRVEWIT